MVRDTVTPRALTGLPRHPHRAVSAHPEHVQLIIPLTGGDDRRAGRSEVAGRHWHRHSMVPDAVTPRPLTGLPRHPHRSVDDLGLGLVEIDRPGSATRERVDRTLLPDPRRRRRIWRHGRVDRGGEVSGSMPVPVVDTDRQPWNVRRPPGSDVPCPERDDLVTGQHELERRYAGVEVAVDIGKEHALAQHAVVHRRQFQAVERQRQPQTEIDGHPELDSGVQRSDATQLPRNDAHRVGAAASSVDTGDLREDHPQEGLVRAVIRDHHPNDHRLRRRSCGDEELQTVEPLRRQPQH